MYKEDDPHLRERTMDLRFATKEQLLMAFNRRMETAEGAERCRLSALMDGWIGDGSVTDEDLKGMGDDPQAIKDEMAANAEKMAAIAAVTSTASAIVIKPPGKIGDVGGGGIRV